MSTKIDERIVAMQFDNKQFERGIAQTTSSLGELKKALDMGKIADGVQTIASRFSAVGAVAFSALQRVTNAAIDAGLNMANALLQPIVEGGKKRALAIEQAKFQFKGLGMDVEATMAVALAAVKGTAFGLDEAATAAANFGASAIPIEGIGVALKGIAGVAALSGSSFADIADVFSKVAGQGRLMGDDLNRLATRGVNAAATLAQALGTTEVEIRKMVGEGKISFDLFASAMDNAFGEHSKKASETFQGAAANMRAALSRIGASFATADFEAQRRQLNAFTPFIDNIAVALQPVIDAFTEFSRIRADGIVAIFDALNFKSLPDKPPPFFAALENIFRYILAVAKPIQEAFNNIFPPATADSIKNLALMFYNFTRNLEVGGKQAAQIKLTFQGVFAIFDIVRIVVVKLFKGIKSLFGMVDTGGGSFLELTAKAGAWLMQLRQMIKEGTLIENVFKKIGEIGKSVIDVIVKIGTAIRDFFVKPAEQAGDMWTGVMQAWDVFIGWLGKAWAWIANAFDQIVGVVQGAFSGLDFNTLVGMLSIGALGGIGVLIWNAIKKLPQMLAGVGGGLIQSISGAFDSLGGALESLQNRVKGDMLRQIAISIAILAASLALIAMVDPDRLSQSLAAMTVMFAQLVATLMALEHHIKPENMKRLSGLVVLIGLLAGAMLVMSTALVILGTMDIAEMGVALLGLAAGLGVMVGALALLAKIKAEKKIILLAFMIQIMANAMLTLSGALRIMGTLDIAQAGIAIGLMTGALGALVGTLAIMDKLKNAPVGAAILLSLAGSLLIISFALTSFAEMSWEEIGKAGAVMGGAILALVGALMLLDLMKNAPVGAATLLAAAGSLVLLLPVMKQFSQMSWDEVGRALVMLGGSLLILAGAMALMGIPIVMAGSVGILAASVALMMLAPALKILGSMSWDDIGRGLTMLGASLAILAVGGLLMIPASVGFLLLGAGVFLIGTGIMLAAKGVLLFAAAITALAAAAALGSEGIKMALGTILSMIPMVFEALALGIIKFADTIALGSAEFARAFVALITAGLTAIQDTLPLIVETIWVVVKALTDKVVEGAPYLADAAFVLITAMLTIFAARVPELAAAGTALIIALIEAIGKNSLAIANAAADTVTKFLNGLATSIEQKSEDFNRAGRRLFRAIVNGVVMAIENGGSDLRWAGERIGTAILNGTANALGINSPSKEYRDYIMGSVKEGVDAGGVTAARSAYKTGSKIGDAMLEATAKSLSDMKSAVAMDPSLQPTIRPILDLSAVRKDSSLIGGILTPPALSVANQYQAASSIEAKRIADQQAEAKVVSAPVVQEKQIIFQQTNNSPKALDRIELYRQSKNLINAAKEALKDD